VIRHEPLSPEVRKKEKNRRGVRTKGKHQYVKALEGNGKRRSTSHVGTGEKRTKIKLGEAGKKGGGDRFSAKKTGVQPMENISINPIIGLHDTCTGTKQRIFWKLEGGGPGGHVSLSISYKGEGTGEPKESKGRGGREKRTGGGNVDETVLKRKHNTQG